MLTPWVKLSINFMSLLNSMMKAPLMIKMNIPSMMIIETFWNANSTTKIMTIKYYLRNLPLFKKTKRKT